MATKHQAMQSFFFTNWHKKWGVLKSLVTVIGSNFSVETYSVE